MRSRRIKLEDGRYLIFYTFDEEAAGVDALARADASNAPAPSPEEDAMKAEPQAEEERRV